MLAKNDTIEQWNRIASRGVLILSPPLYDGAEGTKDKRQMLAFEENFLISEKDAERRRELRSFLMRCRSKLNPADLGFPTSTRRQVSGLRRGEVAELIGVTVDWYRSFESGRPIRVSPRVISRLVSAFGLGVQEALKLYSLAIPEIYVVAASGGEISGQAT